MLDHSENTEQIERIDLSQLDHSQSTEQIVRIDLARLHSYGCFPSQLGPIWGVLRTVYFLFWWWALHSSLRHMRVPQSVADAEIELFEK